MKKFVAILMVLVLSLSLAACGNDSPAETNEAGKSNASTENAVASDEPIELTFPCIWVGADSKAEQWAQIVSDFNAEYEGQIVIKIDEQTDYTLYEEKIRTLVSAGEAPDLFSFSSYADAMDYQKTGLMMDFSDLMAEEAMAAIFPDGPVNQVTVDGEITSIPFDLAIIPVMSNQKLLNEAGYSEMPESFEELLEASAELDTLGYAGTAQNTLENAWFSMLWYSYALAATGGPDVHQKPFNDEAHVKAAELMLKMYETTTSDAVGADAQTANGHFFNDRAGFYVNGTWILGRIQKEALPDLYDNLNIASGPSYEGQNGGAYVTAVLSYLGAAKQDDPAKEEAVKTFYRYILQPERLLALSNSSGALFVPQVDPEGLTDPLTKSIVAQLNEADFTIEYFQAVIPNKVRTAFPTLLEELVLGYITPEEFAQGLEDANK